jgi:probable HAF family extracellular repeat protein
MVSTGSFVAFALNGNGDAVGGIGLGPTSSVAALMRNGSSPVSIGSLGGTAGDGEGINSAGIIVGVATLPTGYEQAFTYTGGAMVDLGDLGGGNSSASAINGHGLIVGSAQPAPFVDHAMVAMVGGSVEDLNALINPSLGWTLLYATGINNEGQIVGQGENPEGQYHAFLLTPTGAAPEPSAGTLLAAATAMAILYRIARYRKHASR